MSQDGPSIHESDAPPGGAPATSESAAAWLAWPSRHAWLTLAITLLAVALSIYRLAGAQLNSSLDTMLNRGDPSTIALAHVMNDFASVDDLLLMASLPADAHEDAASGVTQLRAFVHRFADAAEQSPQAVQLCRRITTGLDPQGEQFVQQELVPAGLYYLSDAEFAALCRRLSRPEINKQIARDEAMMDAPGPAGALAQALMKDPLRLREFLLPHLAALRPPLHTYPNVNELISADGRNALILIRGRRGPDDLEFSKQLTQLVSTLAQVANRDGLQLSYGGAYAIAAFSAQSIRRDMILNIASSLLAIQLLFWLAYRGPWSFLLTMAPTLLGILIGFGVFAFFSPAFNPITAAIGGILAGLGIDYPIYFLAHYRRRRAQAGSAPAAAGQTARLVGPAVVSACATSIAGFSSIGLSHVPGLRDFAMLGALGLAGSLLASVTILPALLRVLEKGSTLPVPGGEPRFDATGFLHALQKYRTTLIAGLSIAFLAALILLGVSLRQYSWFESDINVMHPQPNPALEAQSQITQAFDFPPTTLLVYLSAPTTQQLATLAYEADHRVRDSSLLSNGAGWCVGPATFLPDPAVVAARAAAIKAFDIDRALADLHAALEASVFNPAAADDYVRLLRRLFSAQPPPDIATLTRYPALSDRFLPKGAFSDSESREGNGPKTLWSGGDSPSLPPGGGRGWPVLRPGEGVENQRPTNSYLSSLQKLSPSYSHALTRREYTPPSPGGRGADSDVASTPTEAVMLVNLHDALANREARSAVITSLRTSLAGLPGATITGLDVVAADTELAVRRDLWEFLGLSSGVIVLWLLFHFRRVGLTLLALLPVTFGLAVMLAFMVLTGDRFNMVNLLSVPLLAGCGVDYGLFLVTLHQAARRRNATTKQHLSELHATCCAVALANLASVLGFGGLITSSTPALRSLGWLAGVGMVACLGGTLFWLLPVLMEGGEPEIRNPKPEIRIKSQ